MAAALAKVKRALGPDAVILNTRTIKERGWLGLGGKPVVEICASRENTPLRASSRRVIIGHQSRGTGSVTEGAVTGMTTAESPSLRKLSGEVGSLTSLVAELLSETKRSRTGPLPDTLYDAYRTLVDQQVAEDLASQLIERVKSSVPQSRWGDGPAMRAAVASQVAKLLPAGGPLALSKTNGPYVVALVGPTGVGKTTTIAKLAAQHSVRGSLRVGLITIDTYRIGAVDQLKTYADILDMPLRVVLTPGELADAIKDYADRDLVLIDTAGRSQNNKKRLNELKRFLDQAKPHEVHLVLSTTSHEANLVQSTERFCELGVDRIIFTKLDEAVGFGVILNVMKRVDRKISYLTNGQEVPEDIRISRPEVLAELITASPPRAASA